ncbi:MAG TPA: sigma-70 family RNA polymerase sigma factor [Polyangiaceae bacterium]|nr:sigma-70 family RNA polymerase sigma factor [Polyangiaceae bacterium]
MIGSEARGAWRELEQKLRPYLARRVASPADIDDLLQDIFVRMHQGLGELRDEERFGGWVYRIAQSAIVDRARQRSRAPQTGTTNDVAASDLPGATVVPEDDLQSDLGECVALFVSRLPSPYREAITLTELQGLTQREAAEMLDVSLSGLKSRVQRGRDKIRRMFEECCQISVDCRGRVIQCEARSLDEVPEDCRGAATSWAARERH